MSRTEARVYWAVNVTRRAVTVKAVTDSFELNSAVGYRLAAVDAVAVACQNLLLYVLAGVCEVNRQHLAVDRR